MKTKVIAKKSGLSRALKLFLLLMGVVVLSNFFFIFNNSSRTTIARESTTPTSQAKGVEASAAQLALEAEAGYIKARMEGPLQTEQLKFSVSALDALHCIELRSPCTTVVLEGYLKGLPIGWVEKVLGPPQNEQRLGGRHLYYWTFLLDEGNRRHTYRLQLEFGSPCQSSVNNVSVACTFNFYG